MALKITIEDIDSILDEIDEQEHQIEEAKENKAIQDVYSTYHTREEKSELISWLRTIWNLGSFCEVYSHSEECWLQGQIIKISTDDKKKEDWLHVQYSLNSNEEMVRCKVQRSDNESIRPLTKAFPVYEYTYNAIHKPLHPFGRQQSPINITTTPPSEMPNTHKVISDKEFYSNPLQFNYPTNVANCCILNNGHTVQINIDESNPCSLSIHNKVYKLKQFHFHIPSEHTIDSKPSEMEMHLVHINSAAQIAVLGFMFSSDGVYKAHRRQLQLTKSRMHLTINPSAVNGDVQSSEEEDDADSINTDDDADWDQDTEEPHIREKKRQKGNVFLNQFWSQLPIHKTDQDIPLQNAISFDYLFETASDNFVKSVETNEIQINMELFEYIGSLTTPPFTEGVQWLLSKKRHFISEQQVNELSACWGHESNARAVQKQFGRTISLRSKSSLRVVQ